MTLKEPIRQVNAESAALALSARWAFASAASRQDVKQEKSDDDDGCCDRDDGHGGGGYHHAASLTRSRPPETGAHWRALARGPRP